MGAQVHRIIVQADPERIEELEKSLAKCVTLGTKVDGSAETSETLRLSDTSPADAIFVDVSGQDRHVDQIKIIKEKMPRTPIVAICSETDRRGMKELLGKGAHAVLCWKHFDDVGVAGALAQAVARRDLEDVNKTLKVVNSILRHDVMNNLTVIGGGLEIYKLKKDEKFLTSSVNAVERSVDLIKKMKEVESIVSPKELKAMRMRDVVDSVIQRYSSKGVAFEADGDATVVADEALTSVIDNLVNNAMVHSGSSVIRIGIKAAGQDEVEVRVADEGIGIPDEVKPKIWQEGYKHGKGGQSGLGLYIVKKVMERYGGAAMVEDNRPKGTVFILKFRAA